MNTLETILENRLLNTWIRHFNRAPFQINNPHEADAELIEIEDDSSRLLAITIDTISEEISTGLYQTPFTMGWVTVMAGFSDLAAVGAVPLGIVTAISLEPNRSDSFKQGIAQGMSAACKRLGVFILGGDTNTGSMISLTGCAVGIVPKENKMIRIGCRPGDSVFISGPAGSGSALGLTRFAGIFENAFPENDYRPIARLKEGQLIRNYASCCMDTSDGVIATLDQLMRLNQVGFEIDMAPERFLHPAALALANTVNLPAWMMLAGHHGEFELIFTIPPKHIDPFLNYANGQNWMPFRIGKVIEKPTVKFLLNGKLEGIDTGRIRNLFIEVEGNIDAYIKGLNNILITF
jgi:thiamine-monophosphate kinase